VQDEWSRRDFLQRGALAGVGLGLGTLPTASLAEPPGIRRRAVLGRTGIEVPDIGFGTFSLRGEERLIHHALDRGVTHFDTAESYTEGESEDTLGRALRGRRSNVTITSKYVAEASDSAERQMQVLEKSLRSLQTDYIDIYLNHAVNDVSRLQNDGWHEFVARAKQQGKIRFSGISGHGPRLGKSLDYALSHNMLDVALVAYNFAQDPGFLERLKESGYGLGAGFDIVAPQPELPALLKRAKEQGVGVMAMKTLWGAKRNDMRPFERGGATFAQAAFRWVLSSPNVDALVISMKSTDMVDEYVAASGWQGPTQEDLTLLKQYKRLHGASQCQQGCGACAESCPHEVPISDVLRSRMYAVDYDEPELAAGEYASLGLPAAKCVACTDLTCANACPNRIPIPDLTRDTHRLLG
jgi:predicted aldo/keto reductase-like oxidoreductase